MGLTQIASVGLRKIEVASSVPLGMILSRTADKRRPSPGGFKNMSDVSLFGAGEREPTLSDLREARVVFLSNHDLERFVSDYGRFARPSVIILGDGDRDWEEFDFPSLPGLQRIFVQNLLVPETDRLKVLPIGIESRKYGKNGMPWMYWKSMATRSKKSGIFFGPLGNTHPVRETVKSLNLDSLESVGRVCRQSTRTSAFEFAWRSSAWTHVAAPRGNGQDTHRFWETLYRGSVPLVVEDQWSINLRNHGIPFETISSWTTQEIERVVRSSKTQPMDPKLTPALWMDYWRDLIRETA